MKNNIYQKFNIKNQFVKIIVLISILGLFIYPHNSYSVAPDPSQFFQDDSRLFGYISGNQCGDKTCNSDEVCQKKYRGVLPIESDSGASSNNLTSTVTDAVLNQPKTTTFTCVKARPIQAPASPYRGSEGCGTGATSGALGSILSGILISPFGPVTYLSDPVGSFTGIFNNLIGLSNPSNIIPEDDCNYNNINQIIDTRRLTAPLPVDIFNPLPLPVNVTSPTPLPVVVVDDLALYQQKELIDAPLAARQKAQTIATISDTLRTQISADNLILNNYFSTKILGWQFGALDPETGVVSKEALDVYGGYQNFSIAKNEQLAQYFRDRQEQKTTLLPETFTEKCGNIKPEEVTTLECSAILMNGNDPNSIAAKIAIEAAKKSETASKLLEDEQRDGGGYLSTTANNDKNPFIKQILTPGSSTKDLTDKILASTIDQAIVASGTNCFEAIPNNILNGSLRPVLTQGLFNVSNPLNTTALDVNSLQNPRNFANQIIPGDNAEVPNPDQFFQSLQNTLLQNITSSLSCVFTQQITGLLNGILGNVNIPGVGNINSAINNTVQTGANNLTR